MPPSVLSASNTALITGAASGIGLAMAQICRKHGMKLALVDNNKTLLAKAKETLGTSETTETYEMDVSQLSEWKGLKEKVQKTFGGVDFLMLNAGIGLHGSWEDSEYFHKIMDVNLFGYIHGISTFLPVVRANASNPTAIVLTGSKQGITNPPGNPAYNASKAAVKALAEHLSYDLRDTNTAVHLLVPGWTFTGIGGGAPDREKPAGAWSPGQVAEFLEQKMKEGKSGKQDEGFWVLCPDNDVTEETDKKRMMWTAGDAVYRRKPLSRWRDEYKEESTEWMSKQKF